MEFYEGPFVHIGWFFCKGVSSSLVLFGLLFSVPLSDRSFLLLIKNKKKRKKRS